MVIEAPQRAPEAFPRCHRLNEELGSECKSLVCVARHPLESLGGGRRAPIDVLMQAAHCVTNWCCE